MSDHVVISGTGRAGTSFLVQFLDACGLDTGAKDLQWYERARAGGERPLAPGPDLPYVVKDPWLWLYCREVDLEQLHLDALVLPMRDLEAVAASRVLQERLALTETEWVAREHVDVAARIPGGILYSLSVADQARILAVGFHVLLQWAVANDVRTILLDFPRLVEDGEYLVSALWPILDGRVEREAALEAHDRLADPDLIRIEPSVGPARADVEVDRRSLVQRIHELEAWSASELAQLNRELEEERSRLEEERSRHALEVESLRDEADRLRHEAEKFRRDADEALARFADDRRAAAIEINRLRHEAEEAHAELAAMRSTRSWRMTRALRAVRRRFR